jgi:hypothetical protein
MIYVNSKYEYDILQYCKINNIEDVSMFVTQCFKQGFDIKKYGFLGNSLNEGEKDLITEVIVEKRIEIPVEKIVEVKVIEYVDREVIKEVLVEVPKEKVITKIEYISDKESENELLLKIQQLEETIFHLNGDLESERQKFSTKTQEMESIFQEEMSKKDENLDELRRNLDEGLDKPPVEIIKEVEVVKEVSSDNSKQRMLESTLLNLKKELTQKNQLIEELTQKNKLLESKESPQSAVYLKGSNLNERM